MQNPSKQALFGKTQQYRKTKAQETENKNHQRREARKQNTQKSSKQIRHRARARRGVLECRWRVCGHEG